MRRPRMNPRGTLAGWAALAFLTVFAAAGYAQVPEPEEPELVLPTYVLEIEDMKAEKVEAGLPEEQDLLPPERTAPLPRGGELEVTEPFLALAPPTGDVASAATAGAQFFVEGAVGAGSLHQLVSELSLYQPGADPRAKLAFSYDMTDGFASNDAGAGFHRKTASLEGSIASSPGAFSLSGTGSFVDRDVGLQGQSTYVSRILRTIGGSVQARWKPGPVLTLTGGLDVAAKSVLLTQQKPVVATQYDVAPLLGGELALGPARLALDLGYRLGITDDGALEAEHWFEPRLRIGVELPLSLGATAEAGWHYRMGGGAHLFPFDVVLSGAPVDSLWFRLAGGFRVVDVSRGSAYDLPFSAPSSAPLADQAGWFGELLLRLSVFRTLLLSAEVSFGVWQGTLTPGALDAVSGLYAVSQVPATTLSGKVGLRWELTSAITARLEYSRSFFGRPLFAPSDLVELGVSGSSRSGKVGGGLAGRFEVVPDRAAPVQVPALDASAFLRLSPNIRLVADASDMLQPLTGRPREGTTPYVEPGFSASLRVLVSL